MDIKEFREAEGLLSASGPSIVCAGAVINVTGLMKPDHPTDTTQVCEAVCGILDLLAEWRETYDDEADDLAARKLKAGFVDLRDMTNARQIPLDDALAAFNQGLAAMSRWAFARGMRLS